MTTPFGTTKDGRDVHAVDLASDDLTVRILTYGAVVNDLRLAGVAYPLTLGSPDLAAYEGPLESFGALMGPVVNRISEARAQIDGAQHHLEANFQGRHTLHSGATGTHRQVWTVTAQSQTSVTLTLALPHGLGGFPGERLVRAIYTVAGPSLTLDLVAETDRPTLFSFANHSYWALDPTPGYAGHVFTTPAGRVLEMTEDLMPTGRLLHVSETPHDARAGLTLHGDASQFFDLNYCFCEGDRALHDIATLRGTSGVTLTMGSTAPGLQAYDCGTIDGAGYATHHGAAYGLYAGFALEAQRWPGATSHPSFPSIACAPGHRYHQCTRWSFAAP